MFWLKMNITSSKDVNIGKLNFTSPLLKVRLSKSSFEASGLRISGHGGNTWIRALDLSVHHTCLREVNLTEASVCSSGKWDCWSWWPLPAFRLVGSAQCSPTVHGGQHMAYSQCVIMFHQWMSQVLGFISFQANSENSEVDYKDKISSGNPFPYSSLTWPPFSSFLSLSMVRKRYQLQGRIGICISNW